MSIERQIYKDVVYVYCGIIVIDKQNISIWFNMDGSRSWNKSDRERQILHNSTYVWNLGQGCGGGEHSTKWNKTDSQIQRINELLPESGVRGS